MTVKAMDLLPIVQTSALGDGKMPSYKDPQYRAVNALMTQYSRLREARLDDGVVILLPNDWFTTWVAFYGLPVVHVAGLSEPILGFRVREDPWDRFCAI